MSEQSQSAPAAHLWLSLSVRDPDRFIAFMVDIVGFTESVVYRDGDRVQHAELLWPAGGGLMFGSARPDDGGAELAMLPGTARAYIVCDDPDALHARVSATGAKINQEPYDTPYGSREFAFTDAEGNRWSFGTYGGHPREPSAA